MEEDVEKDGGANINRFFRGPDFPPDEESPRGGFNPSSLIFRIDFPTSDFETGILHPLFCIA